MPLGSKNTFQNSKNEVVKHVATHQLEISKLEHILSYKMDLDKIQKVQDLIDSGRGDVGRNGFILKTLQNGKKLYNTDIKYLESQTQKLGEKITSLQSSKKKQNRKAVLTDDEIDKILERQDRKDEQKKAIPTEIAPKKTIKSKIKNIFSKN